MTKEIQFNNDLQCCQTVALFDMRVSEMKDNKFVLPKNLVMLRQEALLRNKRMLLADITNADTESFKQMGQKQLNDLQ
jgi:hypothetical protein